MPELFDIITPLHTKTKRAYLDRMIDDKVACMLKAKEYEYDYWDGDRRLGYGGYHYMPGRWQSVAEKLIERYGLTNQSRLLDMGCGKGFLLYEIQKILPEIAIVGFDISVYALENAKAEIKPLLFKHRAEETLDFPDDHFDLVISFNALHNLQIFNLKKSLQEMERVGKQKYLVVESYRNEQELFNLECWALTAESFFDHDEWQWLFKEFNYNGDYEFIYFE